MVWILELVLVVNAIIVKSQCNLCVEPVISCKTQDMTIYLKSSLPCLRWLLLQIYGFSHFNSCASVTVKRYVSTTALMSMVFRNRYEISAI